MALNTDSKELRKFALVMTIGLALVGGLLFWREKAAWPYLFYASGFFLLAGLIYPKLLSPIEWIWMKIALVLGFVVTTILVTLTYYLVITPIGLLMRLFGKDPLMLKKRKDMRSFWIDVPADGPTSRPEKPY